MSTFIEKDTIEYAVYNITQSSGQDKGHTDDVSGFEAFFYNLIEIVAYQPYCYNTKSGQKQLSKYFHTESHTVVFGEIDIKPVCHTYTFVPIHMSLNPDFNDLVNNQYGKDNKQGNSTLRE